MITTQHALNSEYALISEVRLITGKYGTVNAQIVAVTIFCGLIFFVGINFRG